MVKLLEKGDFYSKIAKVSIYLLLGAVAHGVKEKEKTRFIVNLFIRCKETQNNLAQLLEAKKKENKRSRLKPTMSSVFLSMFLFSRFHGNVGLNQLVRMRHLLFLLTCDFILMKGKMKPSSYGLLARIELHTLYA